ncbi:MAG: hypothetical protein CME63_15110 [Halobacteriovoraceae bacterium]|nr:hypothetical protein [Halobacteriovoraceae bacterium]|tara:strand:+ start:124938 stop:125555 length:618 start_codon:yes stop_codon:yes gene_type:complete
MNKKMNKKIQTAVVGTWILLISLVLGSIHSWHFADYSPKKSSFMDFKDAVEETENFGVIHFLTPACSCSTEIFNRLIRRGPLKAEYAKESVVVIDDNQQEFSKNLLKKGFRAQKFSSQEIQKKFNSSIKGVPLLMIYDHTKTIQYIGGYSQNLINPLVQINIMNFIEKIKKGQELESLPVRGCSVSKEYQKILDPLGLKYKEDKV